MKRFIAAAFTLVGLVFAVGCVGAPDSDGEGGSGAADESPVLEVQAVGRCKFPVVKMPDCPDGVIKCTFDTIHCGGSCECVN